MNKLMNSADLSWILHTVKMILPTVNDTAYGVRKKNSRRRQAESFRIKKSI